MLKRIFALACGAALLVGASLAFAADAPAAGVACTQTIEQAHQQFSDPKWKWVTTTDDNVIQTVLREWKKHVEGQDFDKAVTMAFAYDKETTAVVIGLFDKDNCFIRAAHVDMDTLRSIFEGKSPIPGVDS